MEQTELMAQRLKQLRSERNISYEKLSKALWEQYEIKISTDSLQNYENKPEKLPGMRVEYLRALADFYGVSSDYILGLTNIRSPDLSFRETVLTTGLSERNLALLIKSQCLVLCEKLGDLSSDRFSSCVSEFAKEFNLIDGYDADIVSALAIYYLGMINDLMDIVADDILFLFDYGNMVDASRDEDTDGPFDFKLEAQLADRNLRSLKSSDYVRFMSSEISKRLDWAFLEKYHQSYREEK